MTALSTRQTLASVAFGTTLLAATLAPLWEGKAATSGAPASATIALSSGAVNASQFAFGTVDSTGGNVGTVTVTTSSGHSYTGLKSAPTGTFTAVRYNLTGTPNANYTITLPSSISGSSGTTIDTFVILTQTLNSSSTTGKFNGTGTDVVFIGGTAHIPSNVKATITATLTPTFGF